MNVLMHNRAAWDLAVDEDDIWTVPVSPETIAAARTGIVNVKLTAEKYVPTEWLGDVGGKKILCLASGGGQQVPIFSAAGADVTSFDNSEKQLGQDRAVAEREGLSVRLEHGDAADLSRFEDGRFDMVFNPCSNLFMADLEPIWAEVFRVLKKGGEFLCGILKPEVFIFDRFEMDQNKRLVIRHPLPYSDIDSLLPSELKELVETGQPLEYSHTLETQLGGQLNAGFYITGLYEDRGPMPAGVLDQFMPTYIATRALKP